MKTSCAKLFAGVDNSLENILLEQRQKLIAEVNILLGENVEHSKSVIERVEKMIRQYTAPNSFNPKNPENVFEARDANFEKLCVVLESKSSRDPRSLTTYQFYKRLELIKESNVRNNKQ